MNCRYRFVTKNDIIAVDLVGAITLRGNYGPCRIITSRWKIIAQVHDGAGHNDQRADKYPNLGIALLSKVHLSSPVSQIVNFNHEARLRIPALPQKKFSKMISLPLPPPAGNVWQEDRKRLTSLIYHTQSPPRDAEKTHCLS